jgi:hypothetical protein
MATIEELLGSTKEISKMNEEELRVYLKDITNLEPPPFGRVIIEEECPIKSPKKKSKKIDEDKMLEEMRKELGL